MRKITYNPIFIILFGIACFILANVLAVLIFSKFIWEFFLVLSLLAIVGGIYSFKHPHYYKNVKGPIEIGFKPYTKDMSQEEVIKYGKRLSVCTILIGIILFFVYLYFGVA